MDSYSLREVADLLGVDYPTLERRVREGAFPGRFVVNGPGGPEMRIPAADVERLTSVGRRPVETLVPYEATSALSEISSSPRILSGLSPTDLAHLRDAFVAAIRAEREWLVEAVQDALSERDRTIEQLREEVGSMRRAVEAASSALERVDERLRAVWRQDDEPRWAELFGNDQLENVDVDALLREVGELEACSGKSRTDAHLDFLFLIDPGLERVEDERPCAGPRQDDEPRTVERPPPRGSRTDTAWPESRQDRCADDAAVCRS